MIEKKAENEIVKHEVVWREGDSYKEGVVCFEGLTPDAWEQLRNVYDDKYDFYMHRAAIAWKEDIVIKHIIPQVFRNQYEDIMQFKEECEKKNGVLCPSIVEVLEEMGLYREMWSEWSFLLKVDGEWKRYGFIRDLDAPMVVY